MDNNNNQPTFTCIGRGHGAPVLPATRTEWEALRGQPWLAEMCRRIEAGDEKLKHRLPVWTPHCAAFKDNHRAAADALRPLPRLMLDFDEKGHSQEILARALELQKAGRWQVLLVDSADVGFQADGALKDVSRCIYMVPADHTLYVDEEGLFSAEETARSEVSQFSSSGEVAAATTPPVLPLPPRPLGTPPPRRRGIWILPTSTQIWIPSRASHTQK